MKLITAPIRKALDSTPLYTNDGKGDDAPVIVKFFGGSRYSYFVTEAEKLDDDYRLYGFVVSPLGPDCDEWGYTMLSEITQVRFPPFGLPVERDRSVNPGQYTVAELRS